MVSELRTERKAELNELDKDLKKIRRIRPLYWMKEDLTDILERYGQIKKDYEKERVAFDHFHDILMEAFQEYVDARGDMPRQGEGD